MQIILPPKVKFIIDTITQAGYEAYAVGGCVRDSILGREPDDWDITTSATPMQVKELFRRTIDTGIQHGTVTVMLEKEGFEVTTYRIDGKYEDSRHPKEVIFTPSLEEDLKRRDFTINAMAYNEKDGIIDLFGGMEDIKNKRICCVGEPKERFSEDALRIMRAVRFSAQLGYAIEEKTAAAIKELAPTLKNISAERIQVELVKLVTSPNPDFLRIAYEQGVTAVIMPEFDRIMETEQNNPHHCYSVGEHTLRAMQAVTADKVLRLSLLFHDFGKAETKTTDDEGICHFHGHPQVSEELTRQILHRLRFDNDTIHKVSKLVLYHDYGNGVVPTDRIVRRAVNKIGDELFPYFLQVRQADLDAQSDYQREEKQENLNLWKQKYEEIHDRAECVSLKMLAVTGSDLIQAGMKPGKELGETLNKMLEVVLDDPDMNNKEKLLAWLSLSE